MKPIEEMTNEEKRIAIAEACGWEANQDSVHLLWAWINGVRITQREITKLDAAKRLPEYLIDLNAMREAEKTLTEQERDLYSTQLIGACCGFEDSELAMAWKSIFATAEQRADAFLRVIASRK